MKLQKNIAKNCTCEHCGEEISELTKKLQVSSDSDRWAKYGQCSVSCESKGDSYFALKHDKLSGNSGFSLNDLKPDIQDISRGQGSEPNLFGYTGPEEKTRTVMDWRRIILAGKLIAVVGGLSIVVFLYIEHILVALTGLALLISGIGLCRLGIWKRCRNKKM